MVYDIYDLFLIYKILYEIHFSDLPLAQQGGLHFFFFLWKIPILEESIQITWLVGGQ